MVRHRWISFQEGRSCNQNVGPIPMMDNLQLLSNSPVRLSEFLTLIYYRYEQIDVVDESVDIGFDYPLALYCSFTRGHLLVPVDFMNAIRYVKESNG